MKLNYSFLFISAIVFVNLLQLVQAKKKKKSRKLCVLQTAENGGCTSRKLCPNGLCCSKFGFCGETPEHCGVGCKSQCNRIALKVNKLCPVTPTTTTAGINSIATPAPVVQCILQDVQNGGCSADKLCPNGSCCSKFGFCGETPEHCGAGCQSQCDKKPVLNVNKCPTIPTTPATGGNSVAAPGEQCILVDAENGGCSADKLCPRGLCCSKFGFCGDSPDHCGTGCQSQCDNKPSLKVNKQCPSTPTTIDVSAPQATSPPIPADACILTSSDKGGCSASKLCPQGLCCSQFGFCGSSAAFCGVGCKSQCNRKFVFGLRSCGSAIKKAPITQVKIPDPPENSLQFVPDKTLTNPQIQTSDFGMISSCGWPGMFAPTFDDGPDPVQTDIILKALFNAKIKTTFFMVGSMIQQNKDVARRVFKAGHQIASHTFTHPSLPSLTPEQLKDEIEKTEKEIRDVVSMRPRFFRPPFGEMNKAVANELAKRDYKVIFWTLDTTDYRAETTEQNIVDTFRASAVDPTTNSFISLQHDIQEKSARVAPQVFDTIKKAGFKSVPMFLCVNESPYRP